MYLNTNIKYLRKVKGITQTELASLIDKKKETVSSYENKVGLPSFEVLVKMAEVFEVSLDDLVFKDLSVGGQSPKNYLSKPEKEEDVNYLKKINKLLARRIDELEKEIKKKNPDLARDLDIE